MTTFRAGGAVYGKDPIDSNITSMNRAYCTTRSDAMMGATHTAYHTTFLLEFRGPVKIRYRSL
ncbi:MAG: hypothetical protein NPIRA01_26310 [Nitrospirales bacterium]|nr:MAG: hypothetical protein NPIRA01_26310 [Nitrospirales bacterium]